METGTKSNLLYVYGAKSIIITSDQVILVKIPPVPDGKDAPTNASGVKIDTQASSTVSLGNNAPEPTATYCGIIPEELMPPYIFLQNTSGSTADVSVWITY
tara:strand:- start:398 stop:700 length:303 start_codon:yes stop_codon:yes gene_type:complete